MIGLGIGLGVPLAIALTLLFWEYKKRKQAEAQLLTQAGHIHGGHGSALNADRKEDDIYMHQANETYQPVSPAEMPARPMFELGHERAA